MGTVPVLIDSTADVVVIVTDEGHAAAMDRSEQVKKNVLTPFHELALCLRGDCSCPAGSESEAPPPAQPAQPPIDIGLTGGRTGAHGWAHAISTAEYCKPKKDRAIVSARPLVPAGGGGNGGGEPETGKASSDPHFVTYDGRYYDLQALGEFVLTRSTTDDFAVHLRLGQSDRSRPSA